MAEVDDGEGEYSRPNDYFEDEQFDDEDDNNNAPQSGRYQDKLSKILEESRSEDSHHEFLLGDDKEARQRCSISIPSFKEQSFHDSINQNELLENDHKEIKEKYKFKGEDVNRKREEWEQSANLLNLSKSSMPNAEKSTEKFSVSGKERSLRFAMEGNLSSHSLKRTTSKQNLEDVIVSIHNRSTASSKSKALNSFHHVPNSSLIACSFKSPVKTGERSFVASTPLTGKTRNNSLKNMSYSTIRDSSIRSDISAESTITDAQINEALNSVSLERSSRYVAKKLQSMAVPKRNPLKGVDAYVKKNSIKKDRFDAILEDFSVHYDRYVGEDKENDCPIKSQPIPVQKPVIQDVLLPKNQLQNTKPSITQNSDNVMRPSNVVIYIRPRPVSHFGFVSVNDSLTKSIFVYNPSDEKLQIRPHLSSTAFKLLGNSVILLPKEDYAFQIQFTPPLKSTFKGRIGFEVAGMTYYHKLIGFGGAANCILMNPKLKQLQTLQYCLKPQDPTSFLLTLKNIGDRTAFVHVVAVDNRGEIIEGVKFYPQKFCLNYDNDRERNIRITVPEHVVSSIEERFSIFSQSSAGYSTKNPNEKYLFDLKIYWGDEKLRERAKKFILSENGEHPVIGQIYCTRDSYTDNNDIEVEQLENTLLTDQDVEMLKAQTRIVTVKICDDRVSASRPTTRQQYRNESQAGLPPDYYVPSIANDSMSETLTSVFSIGNRTLLPKDSKLIKKK